MNIAATTITPAQIAAINAAVEAKRAAKRLSPECFAAGAVLLAACEEVGVAAKGAMYSTATFSAKGASSSDCTTHA